MMCRDSPDNLLLGLEEALLEVVVAVEATAVDVVAIMTTRFFPLLGRLQMTVPYTKHLCWLRSAAT